MSNVLNISRRCDNLFERYEEHVAHVDEMLTLLRSAGVSLKLKKCEFFHPKVD